MNDPSFIITGHVDANGIGRIRIEPPAGVSREVTQGVVAKAVWLMEIRAAVQLVQSKAEVDGCGDERFTL